MTGSKSSTKSRARGEAKQNEKPMTRTDTKSSIKSSTKPHPPDIPDRLPGPPDTGGIGAWTDKILTTSSYSPDTECRVFYYDSSPVQGGKNEDIKDEGNNAMGNIELGQNHEPVSKRMMGIKQVMDDVDRAFGNELYMSEGWRTAEKREEQTMLIERLAK
jgi:hypothetical protein